MPAIAGITGVGRSYIKLYFVVLLLGLLRAIDKGFLAATIINNYE